MKTSKYVEKHSGQKTPMKQLIESEELQKSYQLHCEYYGDQYYEYLVDKLIEEMAELTKALLKERHGRSLSRAAYQEKIFGEFGDVVTCLGHLVLATRFDMGQLMAHVNARSLRTMDDLKKQGK